MTDFRKKILLVEDDWFTRFMMQEIRDTLGVEIDITDSIGDGLILFRNDPDAYGVVLVDAEMPLQGGQETGQPFHDIPESPGRAVPVVAVCSDDRLLDQGVLGRYGFTERLKKPLTPGELMALIDRYC